MAIRAHGDQRYCALPYITHLDRVFELVRGRGEDVEIWAYLHDLLEDVPLSRDERYFWSMRIKREFGAKILHGCELLSDEPGLNRRDRKSSTNAKLAQVPEKYYGVLLVKTADRLANAENCFINADSRLKMYRYEHNDFKRAVYREGLCDPFWQVLDSLLGNS
jgi:(p)ppGpp synthase/HD superfamily hydrolase